MSNKDVRFSKTIKTIIENQNYLNFILIVYSGHGRM